MIGKKHEYDAMALCERELWWYRHLHDLTVMKIRRHCKLADPLILDAGCGTGGMLAALQKAGFNRLQAFDLSADAVEYSGVNTGIKAKQLNILDAASAYPAAFFDVIICNDILCLLEQGADKKALQALLQILKPGGVLLMNLPALRAFNGTHDVAIGIRKRYSRQQLMELVSGMCRLKSADYWPFLLSPLVYSVRSLQRAGLFAKPANKLLSDVKMPPAWLNRAFYRLTRFEKNARFRKPWGSSLFSVLQKATVASVNFPLISEKDSKLQMQ